MKLSEAIRLGAMASPPGIGGLMMTEDPGRCALAAASDAIGLPALASTVNYAAIRRLYPFLWNRVSCPEPYCTLGRDIAETIYHLNDIHRWTREAIADWVEQYEPEASAESQPEPQLSVAEAD